MNHKLALAFFGLTLADSTASMARSEELPPRYREVVRKGLDYLAKQQARDGHWDTIEYPTGTTALCAMAMLMEGSTMSHGRYARSVRRAVDWLMEQSQTSGAIRTDSDGARYLYGHGFALLFLASVYGEEENGPLRDKLGDILTRAVDLTVKSQLRSGGWRYVGPDVNGGYDEAGVSACQIQALRAAKGAGIVVPKSAIDKAHGYLERLTTRHGAVTYSLVLTKDPPASWCEAHAGLTAAALVALFSAGDYDSPTAKKWITFCRSAIPLTGPNKTTVLWAYTHYYYAQAVYTMSDKGYSELFPGSASSEQLTWSKYRAALFDAIASLQEGDGNWPRTDFATLPFLTNAWVLTILQLDKGSLPIYQR